MRTDGKKQPPGVPTSLPPCDLEFIYTALWKKVAVAKRVHHIFSPMPDTCPVCGAVEDMYHRTKACAWLKVLARVLDNTLPAVCGETITAPPPKADGGKAKGAFNAHSIQKCRLPGRFFNVKWHWLLYRPLRSMSKHNRSCCLLGIL